MAQPGFFDLDRRYESLSQLGDPLAVLNRSIPWETFRPTLNEAPRKLGKSNAGRKPYDAVLMFKILVLQSLYNLGDDQTEYQIRDRLSFMRFLELNLESSVPDAKTLWLFRDTLANKGVIEKLFKKFNHILDREGFIARQGQIVNASIVPVPVQRNTRQENARIKQGGIPETWSGQPHRLSQKDTDARWTQRHGQSHYGYKSHISADRKHKLIRRFEVTHAAVHDSEVFEELLDPNNTGKQVWADSAYQSEETRHRLQQRGFKNELQHKGYRQRPLSECQQRVNRKRSKVRSRIEHVFAFQQNLGEKPPPAGREVHLPGIPVRPDAGLTRRGWLRRVLGALAAGRWPKRKESASSAPTSMSNTSRWTSCAIPTPCWPPT